MTLNERLSKKELTQLTVSQALEVSQQHTSGLLSGKYRLTYSNADRLSKLLNCSVFEVLAEANGINVNSLEAGDDHKMGKLLVQILEDAIESGVTGKKFSESLMRNISIQALNGLKAMSKGLSVNYLCLEVPTPPACVMDGLDENYTKAIENKRELARNSEAAEEFQFIPAPKLVTAPKEDK